MPDATKSQILRSCLAILVYLYFFTAFFFAEPYYNWRYAREHGFAAWLIGGEISPTLQALAWPYFAVQYAARRNVGSANEQSSQQRINDINITSAWHAINVEQQATSIIHSAKRASSVSPDQVAQVIELSTQSLKWADATSEEVLNEIYPGFGTHFKQEFCQGERLLISGIRTNSPDDLEQSTNLDNAWTSWYSANRKQIEDAFNPPVQ